MSHLLHHGIATGTAPARAAAPRFLALLALLAAVLPGQLAVRAERIHTVSDEPIANGVVLLEEGKITAIGPEGEVSVPEGTRWLEAVVVTPGLVDAHSVVGLAGYLNQDQDQDQLDESAAIQPELRALDAYNPRERLVRWLRELGVTTLHTGPAPRALVPGQTMIVKTAGNAADAVALEPGAMLSIVLGEGARGSGGKSPGNRAKAVAMLREKLLAARRYRERREADPEGTPRDLAMEVLGEVVAGQRRALVTAHRVRDIDTALRLREEFALDMVLDGGAEVYRRLDEVKAAGIPVIVHPPKARARGELENAAMTTPRRLAEAGIPFAFQSAYESYVPKTRVVLFEAATAVRYGLEDTRALRALTLDAARILGLEERIGSLEVGKDADLVLFDGDPFELTTKVTGVVIDGRPVSTMPR